VVFFQTDSGNEPVRELLRYELTSQEGFIKKSKKTPKKEMDLAGKRKSLFKKG
jgi:hypothetical protein